MKSCKITIFLWSQTSHLTCLTQTNWLRYFFANAWANKILIQLSPSVCHKSVWQKQPSVYLKYLSWISITVVNKVTTMHQTCLAYTQVYRQVLKEKMICSVCAAQSLNFAGCFGAQNEYLEAPIFFTFLQG